MHETLVNLDPAKVQVGDNVRFGLKKFRIVSLAQSIVEAGGITTPGEVEALPKPVNGFTHRLTAGAYRLAAVQALNKESGAGLTFPAFVRQPANDLDRIKRQLSENRDRENMSPMDEAVSIKRLLDLGVDKADVAKLFARPGGRKGIAIQPASNSHLNMMLSFLDLPKPIQEKVHDGRLGVASAYELTKVDKEKQAEILEKAETARQAAIDKEEALDEKLESASEREAKAKAKADAIEAKLLAAREAVMLVEMDLKKAKADHSAAQKAEGAAKKMPENFRDLPVEEQKALGEAFRTAKAETVKAGKEVGKLQRDDQKAKAALAKLVEKPVQVVAPGASRSKPKKEAKVTQDDIRGAAREAGAVGPTPLSISEVKAAFAKLTKSVSPKVVAIGATLVKLLAGELNVGQVDTELSVITGERKKVKA